MAVLLRDLRAAIEAVLDAITAPVEPFVDAVAAVLGGRGGCEGQREQRGLEDQPGRLHVGLLCGRRRAPRLFRKQRTGSRSVDSALPLVCSDRVKPSERQAIPREPTPPAPSATSRAGSHRPSPRTGGIASRRPYRTDARPRG